MASPIVAEIERELVPRMVRCTRAMLAALGETLPGFVSQYRNLNLLLAGMRMSDELPTQLRSVRGSLRSFAGAQDKESARAALADVSAAVAALRQAAAVSAQQELPPP